MEDGRTPTPLQQRIGILLFVMAGAIAVTPLALAMLAHNADGSLRTTLILVAGVAWLLALLTYRGLALAHEHWRRRVLRNEVAAARRARLDASATFQDKLNDQHAVLDRIAQISEALADEGIFDPQLAIADVNLINSHAREALALIEDTLTEVRVEVGSSAVEVEIFDARDEIEDVVVPFVRGGIKVMTSGPRRFAETDPAMFRLIVRGLINGAVDRDAEEIDISVARDGDSLVCTVSDNGSDSSHLGTDAVSPVTSSLALTVGADLKFTRALGRNQYSVVVVAAETPEYARQRTTPIDVLGRKRNPPVAQPDPVPRRTRPATPQNPVIGFTDLTDRDTAETVAARRERHLAGR